MDDPWVTSLSGAEDSPPYDVPIPDEDGLPPMEEELAEDGFPGVAEDEDGAGAVEEEGDPVVAVAAGVGLCPEMLEAAKGSWAIGGAVGGGGGSGGLAY